MRKQRMPQSGALQEQPPVNKMKTLVSAIRRVLRKQRMPQSTTLEEEPPAPRSARNAIGAVWLNERSKSEK